MKKSLRRKLIMSAVAVGVAAVGTTASTYAWFVSNTDVSSSVSGAVEDATSSLYISEDGKNFGTQKIDLGSKTSKLAPLQLTNDGATVAYTLKDLEGNNANTENYITFDLYFSVQLQGNASKKVVIKTTAEDKGEQTHVAQTNVASADGYKAINQGDSLWENVIKAMNVQVDIKNATSVAELDAAQATSYYYALNDTKGTYNGLAYFNAVTGETHTPANVKEITNYLTETEISQTTKKAENTTGVDFIPEITQSGYYKASFTIWMDGWDDAAFDAVASHAFELGFTFALADKTVAA